MEYPTILMAFTRKNGGYSMAYVSLPEYIYILPQLRKNVYLSF